MAMSEDTSAALRDELNTRALHLFEIAWPTVYRELSRMARNRWNPSSSDVPPRRRWRLTTSMRLLEAPAPSELDYTLGTASACIHVDAQCSVRGAIEGWTLTFRSFVDHDEAQALGSQAHITHDVSPAAIRDVLRLVSHEGPGYYPLTLKLRQAAAEQSQASFLDRELLETVEQASRDPYSLKPDERRISQDLRN